MLRRRTTFSQAREKSNDQVPADRPDGYDTGVNVQEQNLLMQQVHELHGTVYLGELQGNSTQYGRELQGSSVPHRKELP